MLNNVYIRETTDLHDREQVYQGSIAVSFIPSNDPMPNTPTVMSDHTTIASAASGAVNPTLTSIKLNLSGKDGTDDPGYIKNDSTGGPGGSAPAGDDPGTIEGGMAAAGQADQDIKDIEQSFIDGDQDGGLWSVDPNTGYYSINADKLEQLYRELLGLCNLRLALSMMQDQKRETLEMIAEAFMNADLSDLHTNKTSLTQLTAKSNQKMSKAMQQAAALLEQKVQAKNVEVYNKKIKEAKDGHSSVAAFFESSDDYEQKNEDEKIRDAQQELRSATEKSLNALNSVLGVGFKGLEPEVQDKCDDISDKLKNADGYIKYDANGYIDLNLSKQWIADLREELVGLLNRDRLVVSIEKEKESEQKQMFEALTGKNNQSDRLDGAEQSVEANNAHQTALFDQASNEILQIQKTSNEIRYMDLTIKSLDDCFWSNVFSSINKWISVICSVLAYWCWVFAIVAAVASLISSIIDMVNADHKHDVVKPYTPTLDTYNASDPDRPKDKGNGVLSESADLKYEEDQLLNQIGDGQIETLADGFKEVNNARIAALSRQLAGIQNAQLLIAKMLRQMEQKRRLIERAFTGLSGGCDNDLMISAVEEIIRQRSFQFQVLVSNLGEYKDAVNTETQRTKDYNKAHDASLGSLIGCIGGSAGSSLGGAIASMVDSSDKTKDIKYDPNADELTGSGTPGDGISGYYDAELSSIYTELFAQGTADAGGGFIALNTNKVLQLQKRIESIYIAIANLICIIEAKSATVRAVWQAIGVPVDETMTVKDLNRANFEATMRTFQAAVRALGEKVEVANRANTASDEYNKSIIKLCIACVGFAVSLINSSIGSILSAICQVAMQAVDLGYSLKNQYSGYGDLEGMIDPKSKDADNDRPAEKDNPKEAPEWKVMRDADEQEMNVDLDRSALEDIGGGNIGVNSGVFEEKSEQLERVYRIKQIVADIMSQMAEVKAKVAAVFGGARPAIFNALEAANYIAHAVATQMLQTQMQALQQYANRHNQMNAAERTSIISGIKLGISVVEVVVSSATMSCQNDSKEYDQKAEAGEKNEGAGPTPAEDAKQENNLETIATLTRLQSSLAIIDSLVTMLGGTIYDRLISRESNITSHQGKAVEQKNKDIATQKKVLLNFGENMDQMESDATLSSLRAGELDLETQLTEILKNEEKELLEGAKNVGKSVLGAIKNILATKQQAERIKLLKAEGEARIGERKALDQHQQNIAALAAAQANHARAVSVYDAAVKLSKESDPGPSSQALAGRLDELERQVNEAADRLSNAQSAALESQQAVKDAVQNLRAVEQGSEPGSTSDPDLPETIVSSEKMPGSTAVTETAVLKEKCDQAGQVPAVWVETTVGGKPAIAEIKLNRQGEHVIAIPDGTGKPVEMNLQAYVVAREAEIVQQKDRAQKLAGEAQAEVERAEAVAGKASTPEEAREAKVRIVKARSEAAQAAEQVKIAADRKYRLNDDPVVKAYLGQVQARNERAVQAANGFSEGVSTSQVWVDASEVANRGEKLSSLKNEVFAEMKDRLNGKKLEDMSAPELNEHYNDIYRKVFEPARRELQETIREKNDIMKEMKRDGADRKDLQVKFNDALKKEGMARSRIKAFNQYVGVLNQRYREELKKEELPVHDLKLDRPEGEDKEIAPERSDDAEGRKADGPPARPSPQVMFLVGQLLGGKLRIDDKNRILNSQAGDMPVEQLEGSLEKLMEDDKNGVVQLSADERKEIRRAYDDLTNISRTTSGTRTAGTAAAADVLAASVKKPDKDKEKRESEFDADQLLKRALETVNGIADSLERSAQQILASDRKRKQLETIIKG